MTDLIDRRSLIAGAGAAIATTGSLAAPALAQAKFPSRPVTLIIPWPAGSATDLWHRAMAVPAEKALGQPIVVENKAGAAGTLGPATMAASAKPDGYTISHIPITVLRQPSIQKVTWNPLTDFSWIIGMSGFLFGTVVRADSPYKSLKDLIEYARANPRKVTYGSPGAGTSLHLGMEQIARHAKVEWTQVPFKGSVESVAALEGGHITCLAGGTDWIPLALAGKLRVLAVWSEKRIPEFPEAQTLAEQGYPFVFDSPFGIAGPRGMDAAVVKTLHDAFKVALEDETAKVVMKKYQFVPRYMATADYAKFVAELYEKEKAVVTALGLVKKD
ncbi:MAG TPA: tripartite tricarboxylate transporter substrate binding protein [Hyphomicrobiaceae bacterium]|nr:tripartite tricarboxylate transporter substrate binding protein [Hyphomicrobiaceae bacterium]